jgi:hypothetical protein
VFCLSNCNSQSSDTPFYHIYFRLFFFIHLFPVLLLFFLIKSHWHKFFIVDLEVKKKLLFFHYYLFIYLIVYSKASYIVLSFFKIYYLPLPRLSSIGHIPQPDHIPFQCRIEPHNSVLIDLPGMLQKDSRIYDFYKTVLLINKMCLCQEHIIWSPRLSMHKTRNIYIYGFKLH